MEVALEYVRHWLRQGRAGERDPRGFRFGQYSDDTQLARELIVSLVERCGFDAADYAGRIAAMVTQPALVGGGPGTTAAALRLAQGVTWNEAGTPAPYVGNGSAMRAAPLGMFFYNDPASLATATRQQSLITHRDPRCAAGAVAVAGAVVIAARRQAIEVESFVAELVPVVGAQDPSVAQGLALLPELVALASGECAERLHHYRLDPGYSAEWRGVSSHVTLSIVWSLYAFLRHPDNYWETICTAVEGGGDTDTTAAIAGAISGARLGERALPEALTIRLHDQGTWTTEQLRALAHRLCELCHGNG